MKQEKKTVRFISHAVMIFFGLTVFYLTLLAGFSTSKINNGEHTYLVGDSLFLNIAVAIIFLILVIAVAFLLRHLRNTLSDNLFNKWKDRLPNLLLCVIALEALVFILAMQRGAEADQLSVQSIVNEWLDGNNTSFISGNYLDRYPQQAGLILLCYLFVRIFGTYNYLAFQLVNILVLISIYKLFGDIAEEKTENKEFRIAIYSFGILFLPGILYTGFIYGNIIGLALSLAAYKYGRKFIRTPKVHYAVSSVLFMLLAVMMKQNYLIFGIAIVLCLLFELLHKFHVRILKW